LKFEVRVNSRAGLVASLVLHDETSESDEIPILALELLLSA